MITNEQAKLIVDMFGIKEIIDDEDEVYMIEPEVLMAYVAIVDMSEKV